MPLDGPSGEGEWIGRTDPAKLPRAMNPKIGYITSSNNEIDPRWNGLITRDWASPFRAIRLHQALTYNEKWGLSNSTQLQTDNVSMAAEQVASGIVAAIASGKSSGASEAAGERGAAMQPRIAINKANRPLRPRSCRQSHAIELAPPRQSCLWIIELGSGAWSACVLFTDAFSVDREEPGCPSRVCVLSSS